MNIIGITGQAGVGKTNLAKEFEKENAIVIDFDKISKEFYQDSSIIEQTLTYLEEKNDIYITDLSAFFDALMTARKEVKQLDDPIYKAVEAKIDGLSVALEYINRRVCKRCKSWKWAKWRRYNREFKNNF